MKNYLIILILAFVTPAMATEIDAKPNLDRYVADDLAIEASPNGGVATRLVSRSGLTARQFWVNSSHPPDSVIVFRGHGESIYSFGIVHRGQNILTADSSKCPGAE